MHTTNYQNAFIEVADDCPVGSAELPPVKNTRSSASIQFDMIVNNPYKYTSDDVIFQVYAEKTGLAGKNEREIFFSKGQPCLRTSALTKRYGWGIHADENSRVALYPLGSPEYDKFLHDKNLMHVKAMRSKRA